jgi:hypothetical protein
MVIGRTKIYQTSEFYSYLFVFLHTFFVVLTSFSRISAKLMRMHGVRTVPSISASVGDPAADATVLLLVPLIVAIASLLLRVYLPQFTTVMFLLSLHMPT